MPWWRHLRLEWRSALFAGVLCALLGLVALRWANGLVLLSYDLLFVLPRTASTDELVILYMDDKSFKAEAQDATAIWDLNLHAGVVDRLTADQAKVVVFDVVFTSASDVSARTNFVRALRENGRVVLAASLDQSTRAQVQVRGPVLPLPEILDAAASWGVAEVHSRDGDITRQYYTGTRHLPSLPWAAATVAGVEITRGPEAAPSESWLNFYGPALALPSRSYSDLDLEPAGSFKDKVVLIGAKPKTLKAFDEADSLRTPHNRWRGDYFPGVEVCATAILNLVRQDALRQLPFLTQTLLVLVVGLVAGAVLGLARPLPAIGFALLAGVGCLFVALWAANQHVWFGWTAIVFVQLPVALAWSLRGHFQRLTFEKTVAERTLAETARLATSLQATSQSGLNIPDHTLVKCVGKGAYGEVWLARNAIGAYHAVKVVKRGAFSSDVPYEREFRGIQKFMPISRSHPGFVHVLHVGRHDQGGYFFYMMEVCDDASSGPEIDPERYSPKTLATELAWRGKLPPEECLRLGLGLSDALESLHGHQLIHRDIKPGNIIYVHGAPKLADIGLVTEMAGDGRNVSCLGTEGYAPPEGPGTATADVYGLGKVLYEACMGRDRRLFPEVPTAVLEESDDALLKQLNCVVGRACATDPVDRYGSAAALHAELLRLQGRG